MSKNIIRTPELSVEKSKLAADDPLRVALQELIHTAWAENPDDSTPSEQFCNDMIDRWAQRYITDAGLVS